MKILIACLLVSALWIGCGKNNSSNSSPASTGKPSGSGSPSTPQPSAEETLNAQLASCSAPDVSIYKNQAQIALSTLKGSGKYWKLTHSKIWSSNRAKDNSKGMAVGFSVPQFSGVESEMPTPVTDCSASSPDIVGNGELSFAIALKPDKKKNFGLALSYSISSGKATVYANKKGWSTDEDKSVGHGSGGMYQNADGTVTSVIELNNEDDQNKLSVIFISTYENVEIPGDSFETLYSYFRQIHNNSDYNYIFPGNSSEELAKKAAQAKIILEDLKPLVQFLMNLQEKTNYESVLDPVDAVKGAVDLLSVKSFEFDRLKERFNYWSTVTDPGTYKYIYTGLQSLDRAVKDLGIEREFKARDKK